MANSFFMKIYAIWSVLKIKKYRVYQDKNKSGLHPIRRRRRGGYIKQKGLDVCIFRNRPNEDAERCRIKEIPREIFVIFLFRYFFYSAA